MYIRASKCPKCWGKLTYEEIGTYCDIHCISVKTGKPLKRQLRNHYECDYDSSMVYCLACGTDYQWKMDDGVLFIDVNEEE